jgi:hypothetical protein
MIPPPNFRIIESCGSCGHRSKSHYNFYDLHECWIGGNSWICDSYKKGEL